MLTTDQIIKIASPLVALILGMILKFISEKRPKLVTYIGHVSAFTLKDSETNVFTHSLILYNSGSKPATDVRIGHFTLPYNYNVYPKIQYSIEENPEGASEIVFPVIVPKEQITISYLYFPPLTWDKINNYEKSNEGFAKQINVIPTPQLPKILNVLIWFLIFIGASFALYWIIKSIISIAG